MTSFAAALLTKQDRGTIAQQILAQVAGMRQRGELNQSLCWGPEELELLAMFAISAKNDLAQSCSGERAEPDMLAAHKAVGEFLNELYAIMVDPCATGTIHVDELKKALLEAAIRDRDAAHGHPATLEENRRLNALLNTPEVEDFDKAVPLEAAHQVSRWGTAHDTGKNAEDWFWLVGYLAGKALAAQKAGDTNKAKHHCISTSAALRNWHAHLRSGESLMRPGIEPSDDIRALTPTARED